MSKNKNEKCVHCFCCIGCLAVTICLLLLEFLLVNLQLKLIVDKLEKAAVFNNVTFIATCVLFGVCVICATVVFCVFIRSIFKCKKDKNEIEKIEDIIKTFK